MYKHDRDSMDGKAQTLVDTWSCVDPPVLQYGVGQALEQDRLWGKVLRLVRRSLVGKGRRPLEKMLVTQDHG